VVDLAEAGPQILEDRCDAVRRQREGVGVAIPDRPRGLRGRSQSGNFVRGFLHLGFNQDEAGRQVYDGAWPIIAGRRIGMNFRWAQPDGVL